MANQVRDGRLDLAFVALPGRSWPGVTLTPLTIEPIALMVPPGHSLAKRSAVELADLADETLVDLPPGWGTRMAIDRSFAAAGAQRTVSFEVNDTASMIEFIRHGLAIGLLPASFVDGLDGLVVVPIRHHVPRFAIAVASPAELRLSAAAVALLEAIQRMPRGSGKDLGRSGS